MGPVLVAFLPLLLIKCFALWIEEVSVGEEVTLELSSLKRKLTVLIVQAWVD